MEKFNQRTFTVRNMFAPVPGVWLTYYRRIFGIIILLELLYFTNTIIHVYYENWEPCFVPLFREWNLPVTHFSVDTAIYIGMLSAIFFTCDLVLPSVLNHMVNITLFLSYSYLRVIHFYWWNNHYYLNMILLFTFILITGGHVKTRPYWEYLLIQLFFGSVYFFAGVSKISTAWLEGTIAGSMAYNHSFILPTIMISWGGFLLDLFGGLAFMIDVFIPLGNQMNWFTHVNFEFFHLHNLMYMFKSIQFFPLHMLFTPLIAVPGFQQHAPGNPVPQKTNRGYSLRFYLLLTIVVSQALFATRRFFILVDYPWQIMKANDIGEYHSCVHHFSWRMKSRTCTSHVRVEGKWPLMMSIGMGQTGAEPEDFTYLTYVKVYFNKIYADAEFGVQPLVNRIRRTLPQVTRDVMTVNLFWWVEVNHGPFQLLINPELNFVGADHLPMLGAPPATHVEAQVIPPSNWMERMAIETAAAGPLGLDLAPFATRAIRDQWVPNPLIGNPNDLKPALIVCVEGDIVLRVDGREVKCWKTSIVLPKDGKFFLKFNTETLFFLGFTQKNEIN